MARAVVGLHELNGEWEAMVEVTVPVFPQLHERLDAIDHERMTLDDLTPRHLGAKS
jgi:hypothetical protein